MDTIEQFENYLLNLAGLESTGKLSITFNELPSANLQTVAEYLDSLPGDEDFILPMWLNEAERERARQRNSLWVLEWSVGTGRMSVAAGSLSAIFECMRHPGGGGSGCVRFDSKAI